MSEIANVKNNEQILELRSKCTRVEKTDETKTEKSSYVNTLHTNVVSEEVLREVQKNTLKQLKQFLSMTFGPMGSNTKIVTGQNSSTINSAYSKDGLKVLKNISTTGPIEMSIIEELIDITRHVESEVGDGTTSTVILSSLIFEALDKIQKKYNIPPFQLIRKFEGVVSKIKDKILESGKDATLQDIYNISMISTNGNDKVSTNIANIYEKYGMDLNLSVGISNSSDSYIREYDGLTITEGMDDPVYINNRTKGTSEITNARIYHFADPIDDFEMVGLFEAIMMHNIYAPIKNEEPLIPTVICCPRISRDMTASLKQLTTMLYQYNEIGSEIAKPPILIITNIVASDEIIMDDIANLCGCTSIRKYIDPKMYERDIAAGLAPTRENVHEFYGQAELVVADAKKTKFINPRHMKMEENGEIVEDPKYTTMINFLQTEIDTCLENGGNATDLGLLRKRMAALKANMVEYLVGGVTVAERDATKDLVEDAIKNCQSATKYGVGRAANFEGLYASFQLIKDYKNEKVKLDEVEFSILHSIFCAYGDITDILYGTVCTDKDTVTSYTNISIGLGSPYDISSGYLPENIKAVSDNVKCSIMLDVNILDTISKIITIMVTSNQCLLQAPQLNTY